MNLSFLTRWFQKRNDLEPARTLCLDFDGVLHRFETPWEAPEVIPDGPTPLAAGFTHNAVLTYDRVVVCSVRARTRRGRRAIHRWLARWDFPPGLVVTDRKPYAVAYLDDRAIRFEGAWPWHLVNGRSSENPRRPQP